MTTLLDALQKGTTITPGGHSPGMGATGQVAQLLKAKTGKAVELGGAGGATPQMSTLGEASAVAQSGAQLGQVADAAKLQGQELQQKSAAVAADSAAANEKVESARLDAIQARADRTAQLLQEYKQAGQSLDVERQRALAEQIGQQARLSSEMYIDQLERAGAEQRLADEIAFKEALAADIFAEEQSLFSDQFRANELLNMQQNQWNEWLGTIDLDIALATAADRTAAANQQAMWTGVGNMVSSGLDAAATYSSSGKSGPPQEGDSGFRGPTRDQQKGGYFD